MRLSIIIPVYNVEPYLERCIHSVLKQSFTDFELILVDDGSTDGSAIICDEYATRDHRIRVVHQANAGVSAARNMGISMSTGDYLSFIDADDWLENRMYELLLDKALQEGADYVYCDYIQEKGNHSKVQQMMACIPDDHMGNIISHVGQWFVTACMSIIRREVIVQHDICFNTNLKYNEDFNFIAKTLVFTKRIYKVEQALYHYNENNTSSALHKKSDRKGQDEYNSQIDVIDFFVRHHVFDECARFLIQRLVRCIYFYRNPQRDKRYDSMIRFRDVMSCPYIGIRGKFHVLLTLFAMDLSFSGRTRQLYQVS